MELTHSVQGRFLEILTDQEENLTWKSIMFNLPRNILQFAVNASIDTLATNANLKRWGKRSNAKCSSCGARETLHHVLNHCSSSLDRYAWRHDSIINHIHNFIASSSKKFVTSSDLPGKMRGISTVPTEICPTNLRPDKVCVDEGDKNVIMLELNVPFEDNISAAHERKYFFVL